MNGDFEWFVANYNLLYETYGDSYIAISNKNVIGLYEDPRVALNSVLKIYQPETFIIQKCNGKKSAYHADIPLLYISDIG